MAAHNEEGATNARCSDLDGINTATQALKGGEWDMGGLGIGFS